MISLSESFDRLRTNGEDFRGLYPFMLSLSKHVAHYNDSPVSE